MARSALASYVAGVLLLTVVVLQTYVLARFRSSNWLLQAGDTGLHVQFRSYLNHRFAAVDPTVVFIPYRLIGPSAWHARLERFRIAIPRAA